MQDVVAGRQCSPGVIKLLRERAAGLPIDAIRADLERGEFRIAPGAYDLVCDFLDLQRDLFPEIREGIRPGGVFAGTIRLDGSFRLGPARTASRI